MLFWMDRCVLRTHLPMPRDSAFLFLTPFTAFGPIWTELMNTNSGLILDEAQLDKMANVARARGSSFAAGLSPQDITLLSE
eukprot:6489972-Amphidinium_carterae.1